LIMNRVLIQEPDEFGQSRNRVRPDSHEMSKH
jgi:hypothetical protein